MLADHDMVMPLPKEIPTLEHMRSKRLSRPDNVFCTAGLQEAITSCDVSVSMRLPCTDHFPITTKLSLRQKQSSSISSYNFRDTDWDIFKKKLQENLAKFPPPAEIETNADLNLTAANLTTAI